VYWRATLTFTSTSIFGVHSSVAALAAPHEPIVPHRVQRPFLFPGNLLLSAHRKLHERAGRLANGAAIWGTEASRKHNLHNYLAQVVSIQYCWIRRDGYF